jgi:hypothetical protein
MSQIRLGKDRLHSVRKQNEPVGLGALDSWRIVLVLVSRRVVRILPLGKPEAMTERDGAAPLAHQDLVAIEPTYSIVGAGHLVFGDDRLSLVGITRIAMDFLNRHSISRWKLEWTSY